MKLLEKILVPTDFHGSADLSIDRAIDLALKLNSEIIVLHILPDNPDLNEFGEAIKREVKRQLELILTKMQNQGVKQVSCVVRKGSKFVEINRMAEEEDVNLVIMGSGEKKTGDHHNLGTTTRRVIESSTKPVWVTVELSTQPIKTILCPVDFSEPSRRALGNAIHLARHFNAELEVLSVSESYADLLDGLDVGLNKELTQQAEHAENQMEKFLKQFDFHGVKWRKKFRQGKPHAEIIKSVEGKANETLLVMGTTGRTGLSKLLVGSVTEKVTCELPCSFITMKQEDFIVVQMNSDLHDLETHFKQGMELLENGLPKEALNQFKLGIGINDLHAPSWDGMSLAYARLRDDKRAEDSHQRAIDIRTRLEEQKIVAEIRSKHWLAGGK